MPSSQGCTGEEFGNDSGKEEYCTRNDAVCTKLCRCCTPCPDQSEEECGISSGILTTRRPKQTRSRREYFGAVNLNTAYFFQKTWKICEIQCIT
eukprot:Seg1886.5 transcript_id=Seg1886.5/GoldUCD/mRNA.D3Y31 product="hypothetical protein" protein_id=Seg1886.5/GoldUCD/D3Y31